MKKKKKQDKEITTIELAGMVAGGFSDVMNEIQSVRLELSSEIQSVKSELKSFRNEVRNEFKKLWFEIDQINHRLDKIEKTNTEEIFLISGDIIELKSKVLKLEQKIAKLKLAKT